MNHVKEKYEPDPDYFLTARRPITHFLVSYQFPILHSAFGRANFFVEGSGQWCGPDTGAFDFNLRAKQITTGGVQYSARQDP